MKITEKMLLDGFKTLTNGDHNISYIGDKEIIWNYRRGEFGDGYNPVVGDRENASEISLEAYRRGKILLDEENETHPSLEKIREIRLRVYGNEI